MTAPDSVAEREALLAEARERMRRADRNPWNRLLRAVRASLSRVTSRSPGETMRAETITFEGPAAYWDTEDQARFRKLAGGAFLRVEDGNAIVSTADGHEQVVYPGWLVMLPEGGLPLFSAPDRVRVTSG